MKILSWNVNGFRSLLAKKALDPVLQLEPDIMCFQEIKARLDQIPIENREISKYKSIWNPAERAGYSGTATFYKVNPIEITLGVNVDEFDREGRVIRLKYPEFYLYNVYFPNGQRSNDRLDYKLRFYSCLLDQCNFLHQANENIIICGDLNTAHKELDLANPKENSKNSGFLPEERAWVDKYLESEFVDIFRHTYPNKIQYTWWTYLFHARDRNIGWRIDYFLVSQNISHKVKNITIHDEIIGSDHCPVIMELDL